MNSYTFDLYEHGTDNFIGQGVGFGSNAIEAFELGVSQCSVIINSGIDIDVFATSDAGLCIEFTASKP